MAVDVKEDLTFAEDFKSYTKIVRTAFGGKPTVCQIDCKRVPAVTESPAIYHSTLIGHKNYPIPRRYSRLGEGSEYDEEEYGEADIETEQPSGPQWISTPSGTGKPFKVTFYSNGPGHKSTTTSYSSGPGHKSTTATAFFRTPSAKASFSSGKPVTATSTASFSSGKPVTATSSSGKPVTATSTRSWSNGPGHKSTTTYSSGPGHASETSTASFSS